MLKLYEEPAMKKKKRSMLVIGLFLALSLLLGCSLLNDKLGLEDDHFAEEMAEVLIEEHLGLDMDLTPCSDED